jgi:hypothetical protein
MFIIWTEYFNNYPKTTNSITHLYHKPIWLTWSVYSKIVSTVIHYMRSLIYRTHNTHRLDLTYKHRESDDYIGMSPPLYISQSNFYLQRPNIHVEHTLFYRVSQTTIWWRALETLPINLMQLPLPCTSIYPFNNIVLNKPTLPIYLSHPTYTTCPLHSYD